MWESAPTNYLQILFKLSILQRIHHAIGKTPFVIKPHQQLQQLTATDTGLGGIDNPFGAIVGGFIVGVLENVLGAYVIGSDLKLTMALILIVGTLTLMPDGLLGRKVVTRV